MALAFTYQGNASFGSDDSLTTTLSGGPAAAGDILILNCMGGVDGGGLGPIDISDSLGSSGWIALVDAQVAPGTPDTYTLHNVVAWKLCAGGETDVSILFEDGNANKAMELLWISDAASVGFNDVYLIQDGAGAFDPDSGHIMLDAAPPGMILSDAEAYVGWTCASRDSYSFANLITNGGNAEGGDGQSLSGAAYVILHHWYGAGSGLASDTEQYATNIYNNPWMGVLGVSAASDPSIDLAGVGRLLLGGSAPLDVGAGDVDLAASGRLILGGSAPLDVEGGDVELAATGRLIGAGRARLSAPNPAPPIPETQPTNVLGCGVYEVLAFTRGGSFIVGALEFDQVDWGRKLDATSAATLTIDGQSNQGALERCCPTLGELDPWSHELGIYRQIPGSSQKKRVWSGPITKMRFPSEQCIIEAFDLSQWLVVRTLHANHNYVQKDLIDMWVGWVEDAMGVENSAGLYPTVIGLAGLLGDRLTTIVEHDYASDVIAEIATTGIDWTCIDRIMQAGPVLKQPAGMPGSGAEFPLLVDESFRVAPEIIVDGLAGGNCWFANGGGVGGGGNAIFGEYGPAFASTPDHVAQPAAPDYAAIEAEFGRIETTVSETKILDQASIDQAARTRYDLTKRPMPYITGGELVPTAPLPIDKIIPGFLVNVHLQRACKPIAATMRMNQLDVTAQSDGSESVNLGLEPIGTVA